MAKEQETSRDDEAVSFSDSETFGLLMEGLRALRAYSLESEKDLPDRTRIHAYLEDAIDCLSKCEAAHPKDTLPLYSLGLALTMKNQLQYAQTLLERSKTPEMMAKRADLEKRRQEIEAWGAKQQEDESAKPRTTTFGALTAGHDRVEHNLSKAHLDNDVRALIGPPPDQAWPLLDHAERLFEKCRSDKSDGVKKGATSKLKTAATLNLAQVCAARESEADLSTATQETKPDLNNDTRETKPDLKSQKEPDLKRALRLLTEIQGPSASSSSPTGNPTEPLSRPELPEQRTNVWHRIRNLVKSSQRPKHKEPDPGIPFQVSLLDKFVAVRLDLKQDHRSEPLEDLLKDMTTIKETIIKAKLPTAIHNDLIADYSTKMGFLTYLYAFASKGRNAAQETHDQVQLEKELKKAEDHLRYALGLKPNWNPAQVYLAQVLQGQGRFDEAERLLESVLGV